MRLNWNARECRQERRAPRASRRRQHGGLVLLLLLAGASIAAARQGAPPLSGLWRLHETRGDLPEQARRALDGNTDGDASVTIQVEQTAADVTVRRGNPAVLLRVMPFSGKSLDHQVPGGGLLRGHAEWRDGTLVANGRVAVKRGLLKRDVAFEEGWQVDEAGQTLTVTAILKTPVGVKRRTQVFIRVAESAPGVGTGSHADSTRR